MPFSKARGSLLQSSKRSSGSWFYKHSVPTGLNSLHHWIVPLDLTLFGVPSYTAQSLHATGQVAQLVERGPEKAGVGGSTPSLATISLPRKICQNRLR
ncbi:MAG: hypothetical protein QOH41_1581 [Blastocatellia bacterium]|nr:hypothetical protein [Blastocatellia bacterium]